MSDSMLWFVIIVTALGTLALRLSFIQFGNLIVLPAPAIRMLRFVPAAVLSALVIPAILHGGNGGFDFSPLNPRIIAALAAGFLAWKTKNMLLSLSSGMVLLWLLEAVM